MCQSGFEGMFAQKIANISLSPGNALEIGGVIQW